MLTYFRKRIEPFDFIYSSAAFKNFSESVEALDEMHRVLPPLGEAVVVDLGKDASLDEIDTYVKQSGRRRIDAWITKWTFRHVLLKRAYTRDEFIRMAAQSQLGICQIDCAPIGLEVRLTKPSRVGRESPNVFMVDRGTNVPSALVVAEA